MSGANVKVATRRSLTDEELALLRDSDLTGDRVDDKHHEECAQPSPPSFRERLALGDISW